MSELVGAARVCVVVTEPPDDPMEKTLFLPEVLPTATPILALDVSHMYEPILPVDKVIFTLASEVSKTQSACVIAVVPMSLAPTAAMAGFAKPSTITLVPRSSLFIFSIQELLDVTGNGIRWVSNSGI